MLDDVSFRGAASAQNTATPRVPTFGSGTAGEESFAATGRTARSQKPGLLYKIHPPRAGFARFPSSTIGAWNRGSAFEIQYFFLIVHKIRRKRHAPIFAELILPRRQGR
jgi:hypothetical protein